MRLTEVQLLNYRSFVNQTIRLDPRVTVIVGRNDTGKTSILNRFFDQYMYEGVAFGHDKPMVTDATPEAFVSYRLTWKVEDRDIPRMPPEVISKEANPSSIEIWSHRSWREGISEDEYKVFVNKVPLPFPSRDRLRPDEPLLPRNLLPHPHYIHTSEDQFIPALVEARFLGESSTVHEASVKPQNLRPIEMILRMAGVRASLRSPADPDVAWPISFFPPTSETVGEIQDRLDDIADQLTVLLQQWWTDPCGAQVVLRVARSNDRASVREHGLLECLIHSPSAFPLSGTGIRWFLAFLVHVLYLKRSQRQCLVLVDEPGVHLHPAAQNAVVRLMRELSCEHQIIYSTHSPYLIDPYFPHRIRVIQRDFNTGHSTVDNKPFRKGTYGFSWDSVRDVMGVALGGPHTLMQQNVLVEGVTDEMFIAAMAHKLGAGLDLSTISIIPHQDAEKGGLPYLLSRINSTGRKAVAVCDGDDSGRATANVCRAHGVGTVLLSDVESRSHDMAIEDLFATEEFIAAVNEFYRNFAWFSPPLDAAEVDKNRGTSSIGRHLSSYFKSKWGQNFSKFEVCVHICTNIDAISSATDNKFLTLFDACSRKLR